MENSRGRLASAFFGSKYEKAGGRSFCVFPPPTIWPPKRGGSLPDPSLFKDA